MKLHLGVTELPYAHEGLTTGDVAGFLEDKYHVMEVFFETHQKEIAGYLGESLKGALETLMMGGPGGLQFSSAGEDIKARFREFLYMKEMDALGYPGVPTKASLKGVSHRFKNKRGTPGRPSFIDTGLYENSFTAWVDG